MLNEDKTLTTAIESMMLVYKIGFSFLLLDHAILEVRKDNITVLKLHKKCKAHYLREDNQYYYLIFDQNAYQFNLNRFDNLLCKAQ